jgi:hypothetical protein
MSRLQSTTRPLHYHTEVHALRKAPQGSPTLSILCRCLAFSFHWTDQ